MRPEQAKTNVLKEADELIVGDRNNDYDHPLDNFTRIAKIWSAILGIEVTYQQVALCMVGVKIAREAYKPKKDNRVDGAGYLGALDMAIAEELRRDGYVKPTKGKGRIQFDDYKITEQHKQSPNHGTWYTVEPQYHKYENQ
jgi:hypothetical protein